MAPIVPQSTKAAAPSKMAGKIQMGPKKVSGAANSSPFPVKYGSTQTSILKSDVRPDQNTAEFKFDKKLPHRFETTQVFLSNSLPKTLHVQFNSTQIL